MLDVALSILVLAPLVLALVFHKQLKQVIKNFIGGGDDDPALDDLKEAVVGELAEEMEHKKKVQKAKRAKELRDLGYTEDDEPKSRF